MKKNSRRYFAVSGDLVDSRKLEGRASFPRRLQRALSHLNSTFAADLAAPLTVTRGIDEISGVFRSGGRMPPAILSLWLDLWPHSFRFGVGVGEIDVAPDSGDARQMDGPAFHRAADALERARTDRVPVRFESGASLGGPVHLIESALWAHRAITERWTPRVCEIVRRRCELDTTDAELADDLGVSKQAVSAALLRGNYKLLRALETSLTSAAAEVDWGS